MERREKVNACRGFQYEIGKEYEMDGDKSMCSLL